MAKEDKEKRIREIHRRRAQIKVQMDRLRQSAFLDSRATGGDRYHQQQAKKDLDRLTEEIAELDDELDDITGKPSKGKSKD